MSAPEAAVPTSTTTTTGDSKAELNINAKPFVPTFGGSAPASGPSTNTQQPKQQNNNNNFNNNNIRAPLPTPPMPFNPMMGMMGMNPYANNMMFLHQQQQQQQQRGGAYYPNNQQMGNMMGMGVPMGGPYGGPYSNGMGMNVPPSPMYHGGHINNNAPPPMMNANIPRTVTVGGIPQHIHNNTAAINNHGTPSSAPRSSPPHSAAHAPSRTPTNGSFVGGAASAAAAANTPKKPVTFPRKVAFLVLGGRGSGKSTQCERLAKQYNLLHLAGGTFAADKKLPFVELIRVLRENFVEDVEVGKAQSISNSNVSENEANATSTEGATTTTTATSSVTTKKTEYSGVVLDRMIALHEYDAYYLDAILRKFGMAVELVFLLMLDSEIATQRALSRGDGKPIDHTRQMAEHRIQYAAVNTVYSPLKILHCVECDGMPIEAISRALDRVVDTHYSNPATSSTMPPTPSIPHHPYTQGQCRLVTDYEKFYALRHQMLVAIHDTQKPPVVCPASLMSGIADRRMFSSPKQARPLVNSYATLKADGQRVLLFKTADGVFGINGIFHFIYNFNGYFEAQGVTLPKKPDTFTVPEHGIEWVLDAECYAVEGRTQIAVFDYLYLYGQRSNAQLFETRLENLTQFITEASIVESNKTGTKVLYGPSPFFLKQYVKSTQCRQLLPDPAKPPFPIDGIVFQHLGGYKFGRDNAIYKWKPREKCTVDFRLDKAVEPLKSGGEWSFVPMVGEDKEEIPYPNAQVRSTDPDARRCDLCDGTIAECIKREATAGAAANGGLVIWDFVRIRPEKPTPNRVEIAKVVDSMEHMTFDELARALEALGGK